MLTSTSMRWLVVALSAAMLLAVAAACAGETVEVPGETVVVKEEVVKEVKVPGETVVVEKEVVKTVEVPGETVTVEVVKEVMVPGETVVVEKEVVKTVEVPGETVVVEKQVPVEVVKTVEVPGPERVVEKVVVKEVPGKNYVTDPVTGKVYSPPEYGGTLIYVLNTTVEPRDAWFGSGAGQVMSGVIEKLGTVDWAIDRDAYHFVGGYPPPLSALSGALAERWEQPDATTFIFHIR